MRLVVLASLLMTALGPGVAVAQQAPTDSAAIHERARRFSAAYRRGDAAAMAGFYTADAVIFPERRDAITGTDLIREYWTLPAGRRVTHHVSTPTQVVVDGDHAYDYGTFEIAGTDEGGAWGPSRGKYVIVWRRDRGTWRMVLDMWNSGPRPAK